MRDLGLYFSNKNILPIVGTKVSYDNNLNQTIPGCNCLTCSQNRNKFIATTLLNSIKIK